TTKTRRIYTLSLHDALPILARPLRWWFEVLLQNVNLRVPLLEKLALEGIPVAFDPSLLELLRKHFERLEVTWIELGVVIGTRRRSAEHTSELQSRENLVCRL